MKNAEAAISSQGGGGSKKFEDWGRLKNYRTGVTVAGGGMSITCHGMKNLFEIKMKPKPSLLCQSLYLQYNYLLRIIFDFILGTWVEANHFLLFLLHFNQFKAKWYRLY